MLLKLNLKIDNMDLQGHFITLRASEAAAQCIVIGPV